MRFLIDCQLARSFAARLRAVGYSADHASEVGLAGQPDHDIWRYAARETCCIVTKDEDFSQLVRSSVNGPAVIWVRLGNTRNDVLWDRLGPLMAQIHAWIDSGERLIEVR